jgi:uncharacterized protein (TIGR02266 family)
LRFRGARAAGENALADPNTRQGKRTPVTLKIKFKSETLEQFIERYAVDVSQGGIFIRTKEPLAVGTQMKFEFQLKDASPLIAGEGTVVWTRENDPSRPAIAPGMGVRFDRLAEGSQQVLEKILAEKAKQAPSRGSTEGPTKPPLFTDTPTKVAPAPVKDALLGSRSKHDSEQTPLPNPMPFHSDAEDFDEKAFEEATKVRALDELVAATAASDEADTKAMPLPADELAARRHGRPETPLAEPPLPNLPDRDSAPGLPEPPAAGRPGKLLDTTPSPRTEERRPSTPDLAAKTRLGVEPAKGPPPRGKPAVESTERVSMPRGTFDATRPEVPRRPSSAPIVIAILVVVAAAVAGVWYFVLRDQVEENTAANPAKGSGSAVVAQNAGSGSAAVTTGSGSAQAMTGGSAAVKPVATVDTVIASSTANATVEVEGTDQSGPVPFTAKLEKDKPYKVHVSAPGFARKTLDVKGGQDKVVAKLDPKPHVLAVTSDPAGAQVFIDGSGTGKATPVELELTAAQAAKPKLRVMVRKGGYRPVDQMVEAGSFTDEDAKMVSKVDVKLAVMPVATGGGRPPNGGNTGSGTPANTGGAGSGSAATPPTGGGSGTGGGSSAPTPPPSGGSGSEPEPDWSKKPQ